MTAQEFENEFDVLYNNVTSNSAPPLDAYEISLFLTKAQEKLVNSYYDAIKSSTQRGFEATEERRRELAPLVKNVSNTSPVTNASKALESSSRFFQLANDVRYIVYEKAILSSTDTCLDGNICTVVPVKHDEYRHFSKNPFKKPDEYTVFRVDSEGTEEIEMVAPTNATVATYQYRYLADPQPIITQALSGVSINGNTAQATSVLPESLHRKIVDLAVQMALEASGDPRFQSKVNVDNKPEY